MSAKSSEKSENPGADYRRLHEVEVSVVMPCLNEEKTVGICIEKAKRALEENDIRGEIIISDNGSTDTSAEVAASMGARVVHQNVKGYGSAYMKGIEAARGKYIVMGDSDNTYDFSEIERFIRPLRQGFDMVMGNRLKGQILPGAMTALHRLGNPLLSGILNLFYKTGVSDAHCGMRSFTKEAYKTMDLQTRGMEFASEMVIKASKAGLKITEIPITLHPRPGTPSHLHSFQDGWRHLRFMLMHCPTYLFLIPGLSLFLLGLLMTIVLLPGPLKIGGHGYDIHFMVLGSMIGLLGFEVINLGLYAKAYAIQHSFEQEDKIFKMLKSSFSLEKGLYSGGGLFLIGVLIDAWILYKWIASGFGPLQEVRAALLALVCIVIGVRIIFSSFLLGILGISKE
ncbi:MAG: glycosyltransferase family 2 protein [Gemmatimonadota bacterium]|nr:MAG: glycosyltransferase family 2 protein [Gemmatimonadota bacterium]